MSRRSNKSNANLKKGSRMKNTIKNILGTPTINKSRVSPGGRVVEETRTYTVAGDKKIVVEYYRRQSKVRTTVTAFINDPYTECFYNGFSLIEKHHEWKPVFSVKNQDEDTMLAQAYGVIMYTVK